MYRGSQWLKSSEINSVFYCRQHSNIRGSSWQFGWLSLQSHGLFNIWSRTEELFWFHWASHERCYQRWCRLCPPPTLPRSHLPTITHLVLFLQSHWVTTARPMNFHRIPRCPPGRHHDPMLHIRHRSFYIIVLIIGLTSFIILFRLSLLCLSLSSLSFLWFLHCLLDFLSHQLIFLLLSLQIVLLHNISIILIIVCWISQAILQKEYWSDCYCWCDHSLLDDVDEKCRS